MHAKLSSNSAYAPQQANTPCGGLPLPRWVSFLRHRDAAERIWFSNSANALSQVRAPNTCLLGRERRRGRVSTEELVQLDAAGRRLSVPWPAVGYATVTLIDTTPEVCGEEDDDPWRFSTSQGEHSRDPSLAVDLTVARPPRRPNGVPTRVPTPPSWCPQLLKSEYEVPVGAHPAPRSDALEMR